MKIEEADSFAQELECMKNFPRRQWSPKAFARVVEFLAGLCRNGAEADWLVSQAIERFPEWPGPMALRDLHANRFGAADREQWEPKYEPPPPPSCSTCTDNGFLKNQYGVYRRCLCSAASAITDQMLATFNNWQKKRGIPAGETIIKRDVKERVQ